MYSAGFIFRLCCNKDSSDLLSCQKYSRLLYELPCFVYEINLYLDEVKICFTQSISDNADGSC